MDLRYGAAALIEVLLTSVLMTEVLLMPSKERESPQILSDFRDLFKNNNEFNNIVPNQLYLIE